MNKEVLGKLPRVWISIAAVCLVAGTLVSRYAADSSGWMWVGSISSLIGALVFLVGMYGFLKKIRQIDERFFLHRLKATRFALILGLITITGWMLYEELVNHVFRWDYLIFIGVISAGKIGAMIYYRSSE